MIVHGRIGHYVRRGQGAIFQDTTDRRGVNPLGLVEVAGTGAYRDYFMPTLQRLKFVQLEALQDTVANVPMVRMTQASKDFVRGFLAYTYQALIKLVP
jgi:hypothetical protein